MRLCDLCLLVHGQCIILVSMALLIQGCVAGVCQDRQVEEKATPRGQQL